MKKDQAYEEMGDGHVTVTIVLDEGKYDSDTVILGVYLSEDDAEARAKREAASRGFPSMEAYNEHSSWVMTLINVPLGDED